MLLLAHEQFPGLLARRIPVSEGLGTALGDLPFYHPQPVHLLTRSSDNRHDS